MRELTVETHVGCFGKIKKQLLPHFDAFVYSAQGKNF
jgi:hypothetical protein